MKIEKANKVVITRMEYNDLLRKADAFMTLRNIVKDDNAPYSSYSIEKSVFKALCDTVDADKREVMETASKLGSLMGDLVSFCGDDEDKEGSEE